MKFLANSRSGPILSPRLVAASLARLIEIWIARTMVLRSPFRAGTLTLTFAYEAVVTHEHFLNAPIYITYTRFSFVKARATRMHYAIRVQ